MGKPYPKCEQHQCMGCGSKLHKKGTVDEPEHLSFSESWLGAQCDHVTPDTAAVLDSPWSKV